MRMLLKTIIGAFLLYLLAYFFIGWPYFLLSIKISFGVMLLPYFFVAYLLGELIAKIFWYIFLAWQGLTKAKILNLFLFVFVSLYVFFIISLQNLPAPERILPELMNEPIQKATKKEEFNYSYRDKTINVIPLADYELWGLVVTRNDINKWFNYYHDKDSENMLDICVIWGSNITSGIYQKMKFKSGEWTCYAKWGNLKRSEISKYRGNKLSNNHLLAEDKHVQDIISQIQIGDQVHLKGALVSYAEKGVKPSHYRRSSLSRNDSGNGACEVVYVEEISILQKGMPFKYFGKKASFYLLSFIILLKIFIFSRDIFKKNN